MAKKKTKTREKPAKKKPAKKSRQRGSCLKALGRLPRLKELILCETRVTDVGLKALAKSPSLRRVNAAYCSTTKPAKEALKASLGRGAKVF